jgi:predicted SAM-dependent methyltransferase
VDLGMKIEFGCGYKQPKDGFLACDTRETPFTTWVCNAWEISNIIEPGSVKEIYSRHFFEHLTFAQGLKTLEAWRKVLAENAKVILITPDLRWHCNQFVNNRAEYASSRSFPETGIFGWQKEAEAAELFTSFETSWDVHKSGYDEVTLRNLVERWGFERYTRLAGDAEHRSNHPMHLHVEFYKASA